MMPGHEPAEQEVQAELGRQRHQREHEHHGKRMASWALVSRVPSRRPQPSETERTASTADTTARAMKASRISAVPSG